MTRLAGQSSSGSPPTPHGRVLARVLATTACAARSQPSTGGVLVPRGGAGRCAHEPLYYFSSSTVRSGLGFSSRPPPSVLVIGCVLSSALDKTQSICIRYLRARGEEAELPRTLCSLERRGERHVTRLGTNAWVCVECPLQHHSTAVQLSMHIQAKVTLFSATRFYSTHSVRTLPRYGSIVLHPYTT
jgi:hypothetical protein